ncbi:biotin--[acetyl-CoA-carboxylase] ligase [Cellulomonas denverensis]|nr:biotin--[acetyl-CoA-carboxylase] ligase [Cellulomonas denverensis]
MATMTRRPIRTDQLTGALAPLLPGGVVLLDEAGSTNTVLRERLGERDWAGPVLVVAEHQRAGRGRAGHGWSTPRGAALTLSLAFRPERDRASWGWLPLLTGLAVIRAVEQVTGLAPALKWPNDVLLPDPEPVPGWGRYRKAVGILVEGAGEAVIAGIGINVDQDTVELPVPHAGSLRTAGVTGTDRTALAIAVVRQVLALVAGPADPAAEQKVRDRCATVGAEIVADLPDGGQLTGLAEGIGPDGALLVRTEQGVRPLHAGDLRHVRARRELGSGA